MTPVISNSCTENLQKEFGNDEVVCWKYFDVEADSNSFTLSSLCDVMYTFYLDMNSPSVVLPSHLIYEKIEC